MFLKLIESEAEYFTVVSLLKSEKNKDYKDVLKLIMNQYLSRNSNIVAQLMEENSLTQRKLAKALDCSPATIHNVVKNKVKISRKMRHLLAEYFNKDPSIFGY